MNVLRLVRGVKPLYFKYIIFPYELNLSVTEMTKRELVTLFLKIYFCFLFLAGCSCSGGKAGYYDPGIDELKSAPEKLKIGSGEYYIEAYLMRDLMPVIDPKERTGLIVNVKIKAADGTLTDSILVEHLWVINKDSLWGTVPRRINASDRNSVEYVSPGGPFWGPSISVDVVVLLHVKNQKKYLQAKNQKINAVY